MTTIITKNGSGAPTAGQLSQGELAVDLTNKELYTKDSGGNVIKVGAQGGSTGTFTDLTATSSFTSPGIDDNATSTAITIDANENVGIGNSETFQAGQTLAVGDGASNSGVTVYSGATGQGRIYFGDTTSGAGQRAGQLYYDHSNDSMTISTAGDNPRMAIASDGNVGIGTTEDASKLTIKGDDYTGAPTVGTPGTLGLYSGSAPGSGGSISFGAGQNPEGFAAIKGSLVGGTDNTRGHLDFYTRDISTNAAMELRMRISRDGNIGIGNASTAGKRLSISDLGKDTTAQLRCTGAAGKDAVLELLSTSTNGAQGYAAIKGIGTGGATGQLSFHTGDSSLPEVMRINSAGHVGIGTQTPGTSALAVKGTSPYGSGLRVFSDDSATNWARVDLKNENADDTFVIYQDQSGNVGLRNDVTSPAGSKEMSFVAGNDVAGTLTFKPRNTLEGMRIDSSGSLLVGKTTNNYTLQGIAFNPEGSGLFTTNTETPVVTNRNGEGECVAFYIDDTKRGYITQTNSAAPTFAAASDERLKDNIVDHESELANVMALRPTRWDWKEEGRGAGEGFIAQELEQTAWSDLVSEGDDGFKTVAGLGAVETRLIKAMQEQQAMIETLQAEVAALKGA